MTVVARFRLLLCFAFLYLVALADAKPVDLGAHFKGLDACFILYDLRADKVVARYNRARCTKRLPPCSTFKLPLALIGFDAGALADENTAFAWDGTHYDRDVMNRDQTAATWMRDSIVWVSQKITQQLGAERLKKYLHDFAYGNGDMSAGLTTAWLTKTPSEPNLSAGSLLISADEQIKFLTRFWRGRVHVSPRALELTKKITRLETSPRGYILHGKTGTGYLRLPSYLRLGWFIAHLQKGEVEYVAAVSFTEKRRRENYTGFAGPEAKQIMKAILAEMGLW